MIFMRYFHKYIRYFKYKKFSLQNLKKNIAPQNVLDFLGFTHGPSAFPL